MIRAYAKRNQVPFLMINVDFDKEIYEPNTNNYIFDFVSSPLRPDDNALNLYSLQPCLNNLNTEIDANYYFKKIIKGNGGYSPYGFWVDKLPILFNLDWNGWTNTPGTPTGSGWKPWGYDEMGWFEQLDDTCKGYFIENVAHAIKNDLVYRGYFKMPGLEPYDLNQWGGAGEFATTEHPMVERAIRRAWGIDENEYFTQKVSCVTNTMNMLKLGLLQLKVTNPDATSIYTWHIRTSTGNWFPYTRGNTREILLPSGTYDVFLRRDNLALKGSEVKELKKTIVIDPNRYDCNPIGNSAKTLRQQEFDKYEEDLSPSSKFPYSMLQDDTISYNDNMLVYPNPSTDNIRLMSIEAVTKNIKNSSILSLDGKLIKQVSTQDLISYSGVSIIDLTPNTYILRIETIFKIFSIKFSKL